MIDYSIIAAASEKYAALGYIRIEVPWIVQCAAIAETYPIHDAPEGACEVRRNSRHTGYLVGSAEQSFLQMMLEGRLPPGRYQAISPCFRGDATSHTHREYFMKLELFATSGGSGGDDALDQMMTDALSVMQAHTYQRLELFATDAGHDIGFIHPALGELELGSYGRRQSESNPKLTWTYGTGIAEPRFSTFCKP